MSCLLLAPCVFLQTYPVSNITPEEWIITMLSFFMMGSQARIGSLAHACSITTCIGVITGIYRRCPVTIRQLVPEVPLVVSILIPHLTPCLH